MGKKAIIILCIFLALFYYINSQLKAPSNEHKVVSFNIEKGEGVEEIAQKLKTQGLIKNRGLFVALSYLSGLWTRFQPGKYELSPDMNLSSIFKTFISGPKGEEETIKILEGWTNEEIAEYLEKKNICKKQDFLNALKKIDPSDYKFLADKPPEAGLQGYLFPDTYRIYKQSTPSEIARKMLENFQNKLSKEDVSAISKQGKTIFEIVTLASLIEKEARDKEDRRIISGIFQKRLEMNMPLESCATVNYILGKPKARLTAQDLKIPSPYNTYIHSGLPPTPINNPSLESIKAAIWPKKTDYLYFLAGPNGKNIYAKTFEEHKKNKAKYLK